MINNFIEDDEEDHFHDASETLNSSRVLSSYNRSSYFERTVSNLRPSNVNDNFVYQPMSATDSTNSAYHNHRMQSIIANRHLSNTIECYSSVSAQLKSTFNQISRQSISSTSSSSSTTESTCSSLPSSIVEILVKSNENLFKSAENLLKSKDESSSLLNSSDDDNDTVLFKSTENLMKSDELIITNPSLISTHENLFKKCLSITDDSFELTNLMSSSSSLDSSSFENIYSLYPINGKRPNSINKSKTTQALSVDQDEDHQKLRQKRRSLNDKKSTKKEESAKKNHYLVKQTYLREKDCLNCRINLIELSMKDRKSLTITIKWPLNRKNQKDKKFSLEFRPTTKLNQMINVHIRY